MDMTLALRVGVPIAMAFGLLVVVEAARWEPPPPEADPDLEGFSWCCECPQPPEEPGPIVDDRLDSCLRAGRHPWKGLVDRRVDQVRYWIEIEHAAAWLEDGGWRLPMFSQGDRPSTYITVPLDGADCGAELTF